MYQPYFILGYILKKKCPVSELLHCSVDGRPKYEDAIKCHFSPAKVGQKFGPR